MKLKIPPPYPKQIEFFKATSKYTAYGGARGGGKSWAARTKAVLLALNYAGIQILLLRRTLNELRENHVIPLQALLLGTAHYREQAKEFIFANGSRIVLGYCAGESDVLQYQGQAYDVIFIEEATQFTEFQFTALTECNRSSGLCKQQFMPRMYFTCNPGGVGHEWVKRLFIDKAYRNKERPDDYTFIKSLVYENKFLMQNSPDYIRTLENLPEDRRRAMLYGDWDIFEGQYFGEFNRDVHTCEPFSIPTHWKWYFTMDYGFDMAAFYWIAVDEQKRAYVVNEFCAGKDNGQEPLIISEAAVKIKEITTGLILSDTITAYLAPPDLWNRRQETGKSVADIFAEYGIILTKTSNDRVSGWMAVKEWLKPIASDRLLPFDSKSLLSLYGVEGENIAINKACLPNPKPSCARPKFSTARPKPCIARPKPSTARLTIFKNCTNLIKCLPALQYNDKNPNDVATEPHNITHSPDAIRGFCVYWATAAKNPPQNEHKLPFNINKPKQPLGEGGNYNVI